MPKKLKDACFQITHSLKGGTESRMGTILITKIREEHQDTKWLSSICWSC